MLGKMRPYGVGDSSIRKRRALVSSYIGPPSSAFTHLRDIVAFLFQHDATFPHLTCSLPEIPHVPMGVNGWPLGYEYEE